MSLRVIAATISAGILIVLWCLGWIMTVAYNNTLGREGGFASEPARAYLVWSARSLVAPFVYTTLTMAALWVGRFLLQLAALSRSAATAERRIPSLGLEEPLGSAVAGRRAGVRARVDDVRHCSARTRRVAVQRSHPGVGEQHQHGVERPACPART